ncbi:ATP-binding protein [Patescibacteria group bacterium]|nr:ATP-binding protein [Patescibacteria group bacterium]
MKKNLFKRLRLPMDINNPFYSIFWVSIYTAVAIGSVLGIIYFLISKKKKAEEQKHAYNLTFLQIKLPKDNEIEVDSAEHMFSNLMGFRKTLWGAFFTGQYRISFEIVSKTDGIGFYVVIPDEIAALVEKQIHAAYPSAEIDIVNPQEIWDRGEYTKVTELKLKGPNYYPIKDYEELKNDALNSITSAMSKLGEEEVVSVQYIVQPANDNWRYAGRGYIAKIKQKSADTENKTFVDTSFIEGVEKKIAHPGLYTKIRIIAIGKDNIAAQNHTQNMLSAFEQFTDPNYNKFVTRGFWSTMKVVDDFIYRRMSVKDITVPVLGITLASNCSILSIKELATIFHFPNKDVLTPNIMWLTARKAPAPTNIPEEGLNLGSSVYRGVEKRIHMLDKDRLRHFYIIGQTGTGKSVYMMSLALQDILNGEGLAIIDPHGGDIDELLEKIPPERINDVILFDPSDTERPMGINMLEAHSEEEKHMIVNAFIALLYKMYDPNRQGIMGPQLERAIRNVMLTAMVDPAASMVDVLRLLIDPKYSQKFIDKLEDPLVKRYWTDEMANTSDYHKGEKMGYFVSKFDRFVTDRLMRNILGQPKSAFNFTEIMDNKKILLIKLAKGMIGEENANFLGLLIIPRILASALRRQERLSRGDRDFPPFYLYVDEFQNFATEDFATILSEARKYKLALVVAHQFISQLDEDIKNAVMGNVGTKAVFRIGIEDAEVFESEMAPVFTPQDMSNLPIGNFYMRLLVNGHPTPPFSVFLNWEEVNKIPKNIQVAAQIREMSRMKYGTPVAEVEKYIQERAGFNETEKPPPPKIPPGKIPF